VNAIYSDPRPSGAGVLIIAAGVPVYLIFARRRSRKENPRKPARASA